MLLPGWAMILKLNWRMKNKKHMKKKRYQQEEAERDDRMELIGVVEESLPGTLFKIRTSAGQLVLATLSGKMRQNHIMVLPGDNVIVEVSPYDPSRGRVMYRK
jgi:translation initiation factor IF-1